MNFTPFKIASALGASLLLSTAHAQLPGRQLPQDSNHAIERYDILGVRLGMPEAEAIAAIKKRFPDEQHDSGGTTYKNVVKDYVIPSPVTHRPIRAGFRLEEYAGTRGAQDAVRVLTVDGRVWAVWHHDGRGRYDYDKALAQLVSHYPEAGQIPNLFDVVEIGGRRGDGTKGSSGVELYQGHCKAGAPLYAGGGDTIQLDGGCSKVLWANYSLFKTGDVKTMAGGAAELVDVDMGRRFLESTKGEAAAREREQNKQSGDMKL